MIPVILGGIALGTALYGMTTGARGVSNMKAAQQLGKDAERRHKLEVDYVETTRAQVEKRAAAYGRHLTRIGQETLEEMRGVLRSLRQNPRARGLRVPRTVDVGVSTLKQFEQRVLDPPTDMTRLAGAVGTGVAAGSGTMTLVGLLGTASTGTAIGSLSGAAATNATLAWLGGGSLAAGGGGMALGTVVLGGIAVGPALAIAGFVVGTKGEKALTEARAYEKSVNVDIARLKTARALLQRVITRISELKRLTSGLNGRAIAAIGAIDTATFDRKNDAHMHQLTAALQLVHALSEVMQTPILDEDGEITAASHEIQLRYDQLANE